MIVTLLSISPGLNAQTVPAVTLQTPDLRFDHGFTHISDIHQFRDGRILVIDAHETSIYVVGTLWVERSAAADEPPLYDVFDERGHRVRQVRLPVGARLVGFGPGAAYIVRKDSVDLEYLERHPLPR